jgi:hypothetical protein
MHICLSLINIQSKVKKESLHSAPAVIWVMLQKGRERMTVMLLYILTSCSTSTASLSFFHLPAFSLFHDQKQCVQGGITTDSFSLFYLSFIFNFLFSPFSSFPLLWHNLQLNYLSYYYLCLLDTRLPVLSFYR